MKSLLYISSFLLATTTLAAVSDYAHWLSGGSNSMSKKKKLPDSEVDYSLYDAEGLYMVRVAIPSHEEQVEFSEVYEFRKIYDEKNKRCRIDGHSTNVHDFGSGKYMGQRFEGGFIMLAEEDEVYVWYEDPEPKSHGEDNVQCRRFKSRWQESNLLKDATYEGLTFEHNQLCNKYSNLHFGKCGKEGNEGRERDCQIEYSSLYIDAFTHHPVELFFEGTAKRHQGGGGQEGATRHEVKFWATTLIEEFEFGVERKERKDLFDIPRDVRDVCREGGDVSPMLRAVLEMEGIMIV
jgi:hypothetical protein